MSGSAATASAFNEYADTCSATATSSHGAVRKPPPRHDSGAKPIACTNPSSRPPTRSASASRSSVLVTSRSTTSGSDGRRLVARWVRLIARPKDVSTTSAPCSWASLAVPNAIEESFRTPVTRIRRPSSSMRRDSPSERRVRVAPRGGAVLLRRHARQRGCELAASVGGRDHRVHVAALGGGEGAGELRAVLLLECDLLGTPLVLVGDGSETLAVEDLHRRRPAHDGDLRRGPSAVPVAAERLRVHDDVRAAVGLADDDAQSRHRGRCVRVHELRAM